MRPTSAHRARRGLEPRRCRPRPLVLAHPSASDEVKASDLVLAVAGIATLGGFCLVMASNLLAF